MISKSKHSLNSSKGVIRCSELRPCSDKEIIDNLKEQGVNGVRNVSVRRNGVIKPTNTYVLSFNTTILPKKVKVAFLSVNVEVYIPNPLRCYQCQVFGHHEVYCMRKPICGNCGGERHCNDNRNCENTAKCVNCNGNHPVSLKSDLQLQAKVTPASLKLPVYTFHAPMHKRKQMKRALLN